MSANLIVTHTGHDDSNDRRKCLMAATAKGAPSAAAVKRATVGTFVAA